MLLAPALAFHSTWAQAITKALLAACYYSVMPPSAAGGRRGRQRIIEMRSRGRGKDEEEEGEEKMEKDKEVQFIL